jgi:hypothetical protein
MQFLVMSPFWSEQVQASIGDGGGKQEHLSAASQVGSDWQE